MGWHERRAATRSGMDWVALRYGICLDNVSKPLRSQSDRHAAHGLSFPEEATPVKDYWKREVPSMAMTSESRRVTPHTKWKTEKAKKGGERKKGE